MRCVVFIVGVLVIKQFDTLDDFQRKEFECII